jgi:hypothetical protein
MLVKQGMRMADCGTDEQADGRQGEQFAFRNPEREPLAPLSGKKEDPGIGTEARRARAANCTSENRWTSHSLTHFAAKLRCATGNFAPRLPPPKVVGRNSW